MPIEIGSFSLGMVAGGAIVGVINHFLAKSRDIEARAAKDFNVVADALAEILIKERSSPNPSSNIDFSAFRRVVNQRELSSFDKCIEEYNKTKNDTVINDYKDSGPLVRLGSVSYHDPTPIIAAIDKLLKFTIRK